MPTYTFRCRDCGPFDIQRSASACSQPAKCPACSEEGERVWTPPMIAVASEKGWDAIDYSEDDKPFVPRGQGKNYEKLCKKKIAAAKDRNRVMSREMRNVRRKEDQEFKLVGMVPPELHQAEMNRTGNKMCLHDEGDDFLKRTGTWVGD